VSNIRIVGADDEEASEDVLENARYKHLPLQTFYGVGVRVLFIDV